MIIIAAQEAILGKKQTGEGQNTGETTADTINLCEGGQINQYKILGYLGQGGEGAAILLETTDQQKVVAKIFRRPLVLQGLTPEQKTAMHEEDVLRKIKHTQIPRSYGIIDVPGQGYCIALRSYVEGTSLEQMIQEGKEKGERLSEREVAEIMFSTLVPMHYLHEDGLPENEHYHPLAPYPVIHRDIKPGNMIIDASGKVHLIDFGIAKDNNNTFTEVTAKGSTRYMAREQLVGDGFPQSDLFSLGVSCIEALLGEYPEELERDYFSDREYRLPKNAGISKPLKKILESMVQRDYDDRKNLTAETIRQRLRKTGLLEEKRKTEIQELDNDAQVSENYSEDLEEKIHSTEKQPLKDFLLSAGSNFSYLVGFVCFAQIAPLSALRISYTQYKERKERNASSKETMPQKEEIHLNAKTVGELTGNILGTAVGLPIIYESFHLSGPAKYVLMATGTISLLYEVYRWGKNL